MADVLLSPGVLARENDLSFIQNQPLEAGTAIIGPTVKGPEERPTLVTSYSEYLNTFGSTFESGSNQYTFLTSIAAYNYFQQGGTTLLVTRVTSGSFTPAVSTDIFNSNESGVLSTDTDALLNAASAFNFTGSATGVAFTGLTPTGGTGTGVEISLTLSTSASLSTVTVTNGGSGYSIGDSLVVTSQSIAGAAPGEVGADLTFTLTADDIVNDVPFVLETLSEGIVQNSVSTQGANGLLPSGTKDNLRYEITSANTSSGTFTVLIRRGNDLTNEKVILESFTNVNLDPFSEDFISKRIGDLTETLVSDSGEYYLQVSGSFANRSKFVRVKSVVSLTPNFFDNNGTAKDEFTGSLPIDQSGSFQSATGDIIPTGRAANYYEKINNTDTQGLVGTDYANAINLLNNKDSYRYNLLLTPGLVIESTNHATQLTSIRDNARSRGDFMAIQDPVLYGKNILDVTGATVNLNTSYAAVYWPWLQTVDPDSSATVFVPASTMMGGVFAFNDSVAEPWFAPAGINRGSLPGVIRAERRLTQGNRDTLYDANVNPIATFPNAGVVVFGQKTTQKKASALDRVNVRRLLIALKGFISGVADNLVFEQNTVATRNNFLAQVNPYLASVQERQGLFAFKVVMDETNNTADVIDRNQLVGQIFIQPTRTAEFVILDFNILPTGAEFPE